MPKYRIVTRGFYEVEAESEEEAIAIFEEGDGGELIADTIESVYLDDGPDSDGDDGWVEP